jgi:hypothetical protein
LIKAFSTSPFIKRISLTWAISLPTCFILGWLAGYFLTSGSITGSDIGSLIGLVIGGALSGLGTALELRAKYPKIKVVHVICICVGWATAMFISAIFLRYTMTQGDYGGTTISFILLIASFLCLGCIGGIIGGIVTAGSLWQIKENSINPIRAFWGWVVAMIAGAIVFLTSFIVFTALMDIVMPIGYIWGWPVVPEVLALCISGVPIGLIGSSQMLAKSAISERHRPVGVWILTTYALIFAAFNLPGDSILVLKGAVAMFNSEQVPSMLLWAYLNIGIIITSILTCAGWEPGRLLFLFLITIYFGEQGVGTYSWITHPHFVKAPIGNQIDSWVRLIESILIPILYIWYFNKLSTKKFYKKQETFVESKIDH